MTDALNLEDLDVQHGSETKMLRHPRTGQEAPAVRVPVSSESGIVTVSLSDGVILTLKPTVTEAWKFKDEYDDAGNPLYSVGTSIVMTFADVPAGLKQQK